MNNTVKKATFLALSILSLCLLTIDKTQAQEVTRQATKNSKLLADKAKLNNEKLVVDSMLMRIGLDAEDEMYPADDIYDGNWNNEYVKAYASMTVPDSFRIDVSEFIMPVEGKITSVFGPRRRRFHYGTDIKLQVGDTVRAAFDGKIRIQNFERRGYGNYLVVRHSNGLETVYGHLSRFLVHEEEIVKAGQPIALGGNTGRSTGPHLHFEFRFLGRAINSEEIIDFDHFTVKDDVYVYLKGQSDMPSASKYVSKKSTSRKYAAKSSTKIRHYQIKKGDSLGVIARKTGISVDKLCKLNKITRTTKLKIGSSIRLS